MEIGVIAEEQSDIDVLYELTGKIVDQKTYSFKKFIGHGCGKLRRKCGAWAKDLVNRGCDYIVIIHDLDDYSESKLKKELYAQIKDISVAEHLVLVPIREIESWLLSDPIAIQKTFNMQATPKTPTNPEHIKDPKKMLRDMVWTSCKKHYLNTVHNRKIANHLRLDSLVACKSFAPYPEFLTRNVVI